MIGDEAELQVAQWILDSEKVVVFTGAGISTESGVPDFRSPGGIWDQFDPEEMSYQNFIAHADSRRKYWKLYHQLWEVSQEVNPNRAHRAVAKLENHYHKLSAVITQNIDGLHQQAGNQPNTVLELHGTIWDVTCVQCDHSYGWKDIFQLLENGEEPPNCRQCGDLIKPATVSFGQALPADVLYRAQEHSIECDLFITIGTSLLVHPAAMLPQLAKQSGCKLVIINREPTPLDALADRVIAGQAGETMTGILEHLQAMS